MEEFYKKKVIRDFLSQFSESKWKSLTILCIEYGILQLKNNHAVSSLSLEDIEGFVDEMKEEDSKRQRKNLKQKFTVGNSKNNTEGNCSMNSKSNQSNSNNVGRPSANWRKGDTKTIFDYKNPQAPINNATYTNQQNSINDNSLISKASIAREKMLDEILYPKREKIVKYYKDNIQLGSGSNNDRRKKRSTSTSISKKGMVTSSSYSNYNTQGNNINNTSKFNSGLQKLQMRRRTETPNPNGNCTFTDYNSNNERLNHTKANSKGQYPIANTQPKFSNVQSRIRTQVEADRKIYEMMKHKQQQEERESSIITDKRSEMSFEEGFSSLV